MIRLQIDSRSCRSSPRSSVCDRHYLCVRSSPCCSSRCDIIGGDDSTEDSSISQVERVTCDSQITFQHLVCVCVRVLQPHYPKLVYRTYDVSRPFYNVFIMSVTLPEDCSIISPQCMNLFCFSHLSYL